MIEEWLVIKLTIDGSMIDRLVIYLRLIDKWLFSDWLMIERRLIYKRLIDEWLISEW